MLSSTKTHSRKQSGNVLWFILLAIFLLGALTAMLARTAGQTDSSGESDKATMRATKMINEAAAVEAAYQNLIMRGCSENTISFWMDENNDGLENASDPRYNAASPIDHSCHMFDEKGGGMPARNDANVSYNIAQFVNIGTTATDLYVVIQADYFGGPRGLSKEVCSAVNRIAKNNFNIASLPQGNMTTNAFTGTFTGGLILGDNGLELPMAGVKMGCNIDNGCGTGTCNSFYSVVVTR